MCRVPVYGATDCHQVAHHPGSSAHRLPPPPPPADACTELVRVIEARRDQPKPGSYTNELVEGGDNRILKKIGEESAEFVMVCKDGDPTEIAGEAADMVNHLQVTLAHHGVGWRQVQAVLAARRGRCGGVHRPRGRVGSGAPLRESRARTGMVGMGHQGVPVQL